MIEPERLFTIEKPKPSSAQWFVDILITKWLNGANISSVDFSAKNFNTGESASNVIDSTKCTYTDKTIRPFIQEGTNKETYVVTMKVTTNETPASKDEFYLKFSVNDNIPGIGA